MCVLERYCSDQLSVLFFEEESGVKPRFIHSQLIDVMGEIRQVPMHSGLLYAVQRFDDAENGTHREVHFRGRFDEHILFEAKRLCILAWVISWPNIWIPGM